MNDLKDSKISEPKSVPSVADVERLKADAQKALSARADAFVTTLAKAPEHVVVAMSGGVDSAVAAWLMKKAGHEVTGVSLRLAPDGPAPKSQGRCCSAIDISDARQCCDALDIPFYAIDARDRFKEAVFDPFVEAYREGVTPIPCLACNHVVKFGDLFKKARELDARLCTGHYARVVDYKGHPALARPLDLGRDQTYYLYGTTAEVVRYLELPLGEIDKPLVRELAERANIRVAQKPDSQEICFVPDGDHAGVVEKATGPMPKGSIVDARSGKVLREHDGLHHFTIGQRRGIGVGGGTKLFVLDTDPENQEVLVGTKDMLSCTKIEIDAVKELVPCEAWPEVIGVQERARAKAKKATWKKEGTTITVSFLDPVDAIALGQAGVFYDGDVLLGGGLIAARHDGHRPRRASARMLKVLAADHV